MASRSTARTRTPFGTPGGTKSEAQAYADFIQNSMTEALNPKAILGTVNQTNLTQMAEVLSQAGWSQAQITSALKYMKTGPGTISQILSQIGQSAGLPGGTGALDDDGSPADDGEAGSGNAGEAGAGAAAAEGAAAGSAGSGIFGKLVGAITSPLDFLMFIAWIFHPRMILRAVEFVVGIALMIFGLHAAIQARGERLENFSTSESPLTRSGLARVASSLGAAATGRGGGSSGRRPPRPRSAPHAERRAALRQRYSREQDLSRRKAKQSQSGKGSRGGNK